METLKIGELVDVGDNKILKAIEDCTLSTISDRMETLTIGELVETDGNKILEAIAECTLSEVPDKINELTIGDLIDNTDGNKILDALSECTLSQVPAKIETLTIGDLVDDTSGNKLLDALKDAKVTELDSAVNGLYINDLYAERDEDDNLVGIWKQLLCTRNDDGSYTENRYTLNQFGELVTNITENMKTANLYELDEAGILMFEDKSTLDKVIDGKELGKYTITGALEVLTSVIP